MLCRSGIQGDVNCMGAELTHDLGGNISAENALPGKMFELGTHLSQRTFADYNARLFLRIILHVGSLARDRPGLQWRTMPRIARLIRRSATVGLTGFKGGNFRLELLLLLTVLSAERCELDLASLQSRFKFRALANKQTAGIGEKLLSGLDTRSERVSLLFEGKTGLGRFHRVPVDSCA